MTLEIIVLAIWAAVHPGAARLPDAAPIAAAIDAAVSRDGEPPAQARAWLALLHEGARVCPASPAAPLSGGCVAARSTADRRATRARRLLESAKPALNPRSRM
jgi:hypothetical protein